MNHTSQGLTPEEARARFWILDANGLMTKRREHLTHTQEAFARSTIDPSDQEGESLINVIKRVSLFNYTFYQAQDTRRNSLQTRPLLIQSVFHELYISH